MSCAKKAGAASLGGFAAICCASAGGARVVGLRAEGSVHAMTGTDAHGPTGGCRRRHGTVCGMLNRTRGGEAVRGCVWRYTSKHSTTGTGIRIVALG